jgi:hypothetical protein
MCAAWAAKKWVRGGWVDGSDGRFSSVAIGKAKGPGLKPLLFWPLFHGLKAVAFSVASRCEAL